MNQVLKLYSCSNNSVVTLNISYGGWPLTNIWITIADAVTIATTEAFLDSFPKVTSYNHIQISSSRGTMETKDELEASPENFGLEAIQDGIDARVGETHHDCELVQL